MAVTFKMAADGRKICRSCNEAKPLSAFYRTTDNSSRLRSRCKVCTNLQNDRWRKNNVDRVKTTMRRQNHRINLMRRFGITVEQFDALFAACDGRCAICQQPETRARRLSLDHCHGTKKLRGFLCSRCNLLLGGAKDDPDILERAAAYLRRSAERESCAIAGCARTFQPGDGSGAGWVWREGYGWHCPPHAAHAKAGG